MSTGDFEPKKHSKSPVYRIGGRDWQFGFGSAADVERYKAKDAAEKNAYRFLATSEVSQKAVEEGWAVGLVDFAIREGRLPSPAEEGRIVTKVRINDVDARDLNCDGADAIRALRKTMHERANRLLGEAIEKAVPVVTEADITGEDFDWLPDPGVQ